MAGIVDAHHHFWDPARAEYPWMTDDLAPIRRPFGPSDLRPLLEEHGVERTVLVQTRSSLAETEEFLGVAAETGFVAGVVGWVDVTDPGVAETLASLREGPGGRHLVGIRHQVHDEPDSDWLGRPEVGRGLRAVGQAGLVYDLLVRTRELPAAVAAVRSFPELRFVVDHLAKPPVREGALEPWAERIAGLGGLPNVWCKLSGLVTEADWEGWRPEDLVPYVRHALEVLGPDRLLFGSDWPVCLLAASYREVLESARVALGDLSGAERDRIFGETAAEVYRLPAA
ncbi:MAG: amidohydrolase family protein [Actinomycetota bacterium]|nr:amidohydrolase family protein [Actinomycetota bacterium]